MPRVLNLLLVVQEAAGLRLLRALAQTDHRVVGVVSSPEAGAGAATPWDWAGEAGLRRWPAEVVTEPGFAETVAAEAVDLLLNVHSLHVIAPGVLAATTIGGFNLHPGPLPKYAGLNGPSWAVYRSETRYGVTVHKMDAGIDSGPIVYQEHFDIGERDTGLAVASRCVAQGVPLLLRLVERATADPHGIPILLQDPALREYLPPGPPEDGVLSWSWSAARVCRFVRACDYHPLASPWGHPRARLGGRDCGIVKAARTNEATTARPGAMVERRGDAVCVACADETVAVSLVELDGAYSPAGAISLAGERDEPKASAAAGGSDA